MPDNEREKSSPVIPRKYKAGLAMAQRKLSAAKLQQIHDLAAGWGKSVARRLTSSLVESLVGEFNARLKSRQKYWNRPEGAEAILQLRAAILSEDDRLTRFFAGRPGNPYRRRKAS